MAKKQKATATRNSCLELLKASKTLRKSTNQTWNLAPKAAMFIKKAKTVDGKKKTTRTKRLIGNHAYRVCASGAALYVDSVLQREARVLRAEIGTESRRAPWLPSFSKGAVLLLEQFLAAYTQTAAQHAADLRKGLGGATRISGKMMRFGLEVAHEKVFNSAFTPMQTIVCKPPAKKAAKKGGGAEAEDEYEPPDKQTASQDSDAEEETNDAEEEDE